MLERNPKETGLVSRKPAQRVASTQLREPSRASALRGSRMR
jgi:hypothetical protein